MARGVAETGRILGVDQEQEVKSVGPRLSGLHERKSAKADVRLSRSNLRMMSLVRP